MYDKPPKLRGIRRKGDYIRRAGLKKTFSNDPFNNHQSLEI